MYNLVKVGFFKLLIKITSDGSEYVRIFYVFTYIFILIYEKK